MKIYMKLDLNTTVFDIVGYVQEKYKGHHFCSLAACLENGMLGFVPCTYHPANEDALPKWVKFLSTREEPPCVFEHFLQSVRKKHPGVSFQELYVESTENYQFVGIKPFPNR